MFYKNRQSVRCWLYQILLHNEAGITKREKIIRK